MKIEKELSELIDYLNEEEKENIKKAEQFLEKNFKPPEIIHNKRIANILAQSNQNPETIISGLLYKGYNYEKEIKTLFGEEIFNIVFGQKTLKEIKDKNKFSKTNPIRQIIFTTIKDPRIIFIKLASKLSHLIRIEKIKNIPKESINEITNNALEIYAPLATRLGLEQIRKGLEDYSLKIKNPKKYSEIQKYLKESEEERKEEIKKIIENVKKLLQKKVEIIKIKGREKQIFSIYEKIVNRKVPLNKQKDHYAIRVITPSVEECYNALNIIKTEYEEIPETFKDYIKNPKQNGYQSLHTIVKTPNKKMLEVQIRTERMDEFAEEGVAAHFLYKGIKSNLTFEKKVGWLKEILNLQTNTALKELKLDLFEDKIYCYTPKGQAYALPKGASVLDFAYQIHGEIGSKAIGSLVNKKFMPLKTKISNGDIIEIITNKFQRPRRNWMKFVITEKAKKIISRDVQRFENIPVAKTYLKEETNENQIENLIETPGLKNPRIIYAKCCNPLPPEEIIGISRSQKRITIHKENCDKIKNSNLHKTPVEWKEHYNKPIKIFVLGYDRPGILADLLNTIIRQGIKAKEASAKTIENNQTQCTFILNLENSQALIEVINRLYKIKGIKKIWVE